MSVARVLCSSCVLLMWVVLVLSAEESSRASLPGIPEIRLAGDAILQCFSQNESASRCLKRKALVLLNRANTREEIPLWDGVSIVKENGRAFSSESEEPIPEEELRSLSTESLDQMISEKVSTLFNSHNLQIASAEEEEGVVEGRQKKRNRRLMRYALAGFLALATSFYHVSLKIIAAVAAKALVVAKVALFIGSLTGLKKLLEGNGGGHTSSTYEVVAHDGHRKRSYKIHEIPAEGAAGELPYRGYAHMPIQYVHEPLSDDVAMGVDPYSAHLPDTAR